LNSSRILKNLAALVGSKIVGDFFLFILFVTISRKYGQEGIGVYSFAIAITGYIAVISDWGLYNNTIKRLSTSASSESFRYDIGIIISTRLILVVCATLMLYLLSLLVPGDKTLTLALLIVGFFQIITRFHSGVFAIFISQDDMPLASLLEACLKLFNVSFCLLVIFSGAELILALISLVITSLLYVGTVLYYLRKKYRAATIKFNLRKSYFILKESTHNAFASLLFQISSRLDVILLGLFLGPASAGIYNVAYRIIFMLQFLPHQISITIFPSISKVYLENPSKLPEFFAQGLNYLVLIATPIALGLALISLELITLVFGSEFDGSIVILQLLSILLFLMFFTHFFSMFLMSCNLEKARMRGYAICLVVSLITNLILIPLFGTIGAAISVIITEVILISYFWIKLSHFAHTKDISKRAFFAIMGGIALVIITEYLNLEEIMFKVPAAILIYVLVVSSCRDIRQNELALIFSRLVKLIRK